MTTSVETDKKRIYIGMGIAALSAILFGIQPFLVRVIGSHGVSAYAAPFWRFVFGSMIILAMSKTTRKFPIEIPSTMAVPMLGGSISYALTPILLYVAYDYIDTGVATTLHFVYPVVVMLILVLLFHQKMRGSNVLCLVMSVAGVALMYLPTGGEGGFFSGSGTIYGMTLAVLSGVVYSFYIVILGQSRMSELHPLTSSFWICFLSAVEIGLFMAFAGGFSVPDNATGWAVLILFSCTSTAAIVLFQVGVQMCGGVRSSLLSTFEPLTSIIIGILVYSEALSFTGIISIVLILLATIILVLKP